MLVAAMNPCPCGHAGSANGRCRCSPDQVARYRGKLSGPLLDRLDIIIEVPLLDHAEMFAQPAGESSEVVRGRVERAWARQRERQGEPNSRLAPGRVDALCAPDSEGRALLAHAIGRLNLSARGYHRILKVARTIADLAGAERVGPTHLAEAIHYRRGLDAR
jgi:magnesium chelatase family protein